jgi:hypothetical protein
MRAALRGPALRHQLLGGVDSSLGGVNGAADGPHVVPCDVAALHPRCRPRYLAGHAPRCFGSAGARSIPTPAACRCVTGGRADWRLRLWVVRWVCLEGLGQQMWQRQERLRAADECGVQLKRLQELRDKRCGSVST